MGLATIPEAVADFAAGKFVIVVDDEDRENEGDLVVAAQMVTAEHISFMTRHGSGLVCMPVKARRLDELGIAPMVDRNTSRLGTAFSISIDAKDLVTTGASAHDRAATIRKVLDPDAKGLDFSMPGHTFPLRAAEGGVLTRAGQTEAAVDLAVLAGLYPAGVITELMKSDGTMARMPDLELFAAEHHIKLVTVEQLISYRRRNEKLVARRVEASIPIGDPPTLWKLFAYEDVLRHENHLALVLGEIDPAKPVLLRAHSECLTGDIFGSLRCDCGACTSATRKGAASASSTSCTLTTSRISDSTRSRRTRPSAIHRTSATTGSAARSFTTWASARSACSPTTRRRSMDSKASASRWSSGFRSACRQIRTTSATSTPSGRSWAICSRLG